MKRYYAPDEALADDIRAHENTVTAEIRRVYLASDVQQLARECLPRIQLMIEGNAPEVYEEIDKCKALRKKLRQLAEGTP